MKKSVVAQFVAYLVLRVPPRQRERPQWKIYLQLVEWLRRLAIRMFGDSVAVYTLDGTDLLIPMSHRLPLIRLAHPQYATNLARVAAAVKAKYPNMTLIDIGANVGDTVAILRREAEFPILCIDGDHGFISILRRNAQEWRDVDVVEAFVGEAVGQFAGSLQVTGGTGHLVHGDANAQSSLAIRSLSNILVDHPRFSNARMIKIDTDGFDCRILKGEESLLAVLKPVVFFEYDPYFFEKLEDDGYEVFGMFRRIGYKAALIFENTGRFLALVELRDERLLQDIHSYFSGWGGHRYCDVCVMHECDDDLLVSARAAELALSRRH